METSSTNQRNPDVRDIKFKERATFNLVTNIVYAVINALVGFLLVPYFINTLGTAAYGIIPVATSVTSYVMLIVNSLFVALGRYLIFDLRKGDVEQANRTFNTSFLIVSGIVVALIPIALVVAFFAPQLFSIDGLIASDVIWLFALVFGSSLITIIGSTVTQTLFAQNLNGVRNIINFCQLAVQIGLILILFSFFGPSLMHIGIAYFIGALVQLTLSLILSRVCVPQIKITPKLFAKNKVKDLLSMAFWALVQNGGFLMRMNCGIIIVNIVCGLVFGTYYSIVIAFYSIIIAAIGTVTTVFSPKVFADVANNNYDSLVHFSKLAIKLTCLLVGIFIGFFTVYSSEILTLWVGTEFASLAGFVVLAIIPAIFYAPVTFIAAILLGTLHHRLYAIINCIFGGVMISLAIPMSIFFGIPGVLISGIIVAILCDFVVIIWYAAKIIHKPALTFYLSYLPGILFIIPVIGIAYLFKLILKGSSLWSLILACILIGVISLFLALLIVFKKREKEALRSCLPNFIQRILPKWLM